MIPFKSLKEAIKYLETIFENKKYIKDIKTYGINVNDQHLEFIGEGISRVVFEFKVKNKSYVVKFNYNDLSNVAFHLTVSEEEAEDVDFNVFEYKFWKKLDKFPIIKKLLCPIVHYHKIKKHSFIIMPMVRQVTDDELMYSKKYNLISKHFSDHHHGNVGYLSNKLVVIDYAYLPDETSKKDLKDTEEALKDAGI